MYTHRKILTLTRQPPRPQTPSHARTRPRPLPHSLLLARPSLCDSATHPSPSSAATPSPPSPSSLTRRARPLSFTPDPTKSMAGAPPGGWIRRRPSRSAPSPSSSPLAPLPSPFFPGGCPSPPPSSPGRIRPSLSRIRPVAAVVVVVAGGGAWWWLRPSPLPSSPPPAPLPSRFFYPGGRPLFSIILSWWERKCLCCTGVVLVLIQFIFC